MFIFIMGRSDDTHVVDFKNIQGKYRTLCGKTFYQKQNITTLGADNTFPGICQTCKKYYDEMYSSDLESDIRILRSTIRELSSIPTYHRYDFIGPKAKYEPVWDRAWSKLTRAKSVLRNKSSKYYGK